MDPRFKTAAFSKKQNGALGKEMLINKITGRILNAESPVTPVDTAPPASDEPLPSTSSQTWSAILNDDDESSASQDEDETVTISVRREVNSYLKEKRSDLKSDPLDFWKANKTVYPNLSDIARKYHSAPPSSAAPERLFSTARQVLKPTRQSLKPANFEANLFLKKNLAALNYSTEFSTCPDDFIAPNSSITPPPENVFPAEYDSEDSDIVISSDEE